MSSTANANPEVISELTKAFAFPISAYDGLVDKFIGELHEGLIYEQKMVNTAAFVLAISCFIHFGWIKKKSLSNKCFLFFSLTLIRCYWEIANDSHVRL